MKKKLFKKFKKLMMNRKIVKKLKKLRKFVELGNAQKNHSQLTLNWL